MPKPITQNTLFYGDNLPILREHFPDECDRPDLPSTRRSIRSRSYNVLFKEEGGEEAEAQITAFEDTWHRGADAERTYHEMVLKRARERGADDRRAARVCGDCTR